MAKKKKRQLKPFSGEEALALARKGKDAWNEWAEKKKNAGREVYFTGVDFTAEKNKTISFKGFTFPGDVYFSRAKFLRIGFHEATFEGNAGFHEATFEGNTRFRKATFEGPAGFDGTTFEGNAVFIGATFKGDARFGGATFKGTAGFNGINFERPAGFDGATFAGPARFDRSIFAGTARFDGATFAGTARFGRAIFKGDSRFRRASFDEDARFGGATFKEIARFVNATFKGNAGFARATFKGDARFDAATFEKDAGFYEATFEKDAGFGGGTFIGSVNLNVRRFQIVPNFRRSEFKKHVTLHGIEVDFRRPADPADADRYRRLKELAVAARDHDRAQEFFSYELIAKRGHETHGLARVLSYFYESLGGFGRSIALPFFWLIVVWFGFGVLYRWLATKDTSSLWDGLLFSSAQLFPFLGASRGALDDAKAALSEDPALDAWINALGMLEGGLGILFLFLIGLALRNRFRI